MFYFQNIAAHNSRFFCRWSSYCFFFLSLFYLFIEFPTNFCIFDMPNLCSWCVDFFLSFFLLLFLANSVVVVCWLVFFSYSYNGFVPEFLFIRTKFSFFRLFFSFCFIIFFWQCYCQWLTVVIRFVILFALLISLRLFSHLFFFSFFFFVCAKRKRVILMRFRIFAFFLFLPLIQKPFSLLHKIVAFVLNVAKKKRKLKRIFRTNVIFWFCKIIMKAPSVWMLHVIFLLFFFLLLHFKQQEN